MPGDVSCGTSPHGLRRNVTLGLRTTSRSERRRIIGLPTWLMGHATPAPRSSVLFSRLTHDSYWSGSPTLRATMIEQRRSRHRAVHAAASVKPAELSTLSGRQHLPPRAAGRRAGGHVPRAGLCGLAGAVEPHPRSTVSPSRLASLASSPSWASRATPRAFNVASACRISTA